VDGEAQVKVAVVCPYDLGIPGGGQDQAIRLTRWLNEAGSEAVLIGPGTSGPSGAVLLGPTTTMAINRSRAPVMLDPRAGARVREALDTGFDVVHVNEPFVPVVGVAAMRAGGAARVATFHADPPGWVRSIYRAGKGMVRSLLGEAVVTAVSPVAASAIDGLIEYRVIPNGIDTTEYATGPKEPRLVTFLGRDDPRKGLSVALEAWPLIREAVADAELHVIGAERTGRIDGVTFLGRVSEQQKRAELAASTVHVAPNLGGESFGIAVLEAMASAAAVVASDLTAFSFVAADSAVLIPRGDARRLADEVVTLLLEPLRAADLGAAARQRSLDFDSEVVTAAYLEAYQDAIG
jgi:phosphatidyl-myo-inositol alpha-mannosyltransferase